MNPALWVAKTGLDAQQTNMAVISNNLANVNTTGFKKSRAVFQDLLYQNVSQVGAATSQNTQAPSGLELGTGVSLVATEKVYTQGNLNQTGNALDRSKVTKRFKEACVDAKVSPIRFHDLRHTFASWYMMCGGDLYELSKLLGHSNIKMTERYAKLAREHIVKTGSVSREIWKKLKIKEAAREDAQERRKRLP